jgi:hypothetical protein
MTKPITDYLSQHQGTILKAFLSFIFLLFIGILVMVYFISKSANPILLDETGKPINVQSTNH